MSYAKLEFALGDYCMIAVPILLPYMPDVLIDMLGRARTSRRTQAAVLFADISGFTAMTAAFATNTSSGAASAGAATAGAATAGAEELTDIINRFFTALVDVVGNHHGDILSFSGDALAVAFCGPASQARSLITRASRCALAMQSAAQMFAQVQTSRGFFALSIKIGLSFGSMHADIIDDGTGHKRFLAAGKALTWAGQAEHDTERGQIGWHASVDSFRDLLMYPAMLKTGAASAARRPRIGRTLLDIDDVVLQQFIPAVLAERVLSGQSSLLSEHRPVTVMFVNIADTTNSLTTRRMLIPAMAAVHQHGGHVTRLDSADKGLRLLALFGAPVVHEDDAERATRCALFILEYLGRRGRIGMASGVLFCGDVGALQRREYTVMGDAVNVAARLMQHAKWGQALANVVTQTQTLATIAWRTLEPLSLKGKVDPVPCYQPLTILDEAPYDDDTVLLGRAHEQRLLEQAVRQTTQHGHTLLVIGEAGMGKSRLAAHAIGLAHKMDARVYLASSQPYGQARYALAQQLLRAMLNLPASTRIEDWRSGMQAWLNQHAPQLQSRMAFVRLALGQSTDEDGWVAQLDAETREQMLHDTIWTVLCAYGQPTVVIVDDAHWLDDGSRALLGHMSMHSEATHTAVLVFSRPEGKPELPHVEKLSLGELDPPDAHLLATHVAKRAQLPDTAQTRTLLHRIAQRAQGNPLFIEQLVLFAQQQGGALSDDNVPDDLRSLLLQRIDQLPQVAQLLLKTACVIGPVFHVDWVQACWPAAQSIGPDQLREQLAMLVQLDLMRVGADEAWASHHFRHATLREAAYSALSFATRATLHERIGLHIEQHYVDQPTQFIEMLAHHFGQSKNTDKQRLYYRWAGDVAFAGFANATAVGHYERLLPLLDGSEQADVLMQLGDVQAHTGQWAPAEVHFREALVLAERWMQPQTQAQAQRAMGQLLARSHSYIESARWLQQARDQFIRLHDQRSLCNTLTHLSFAQLELGELGAAVDTAQMQWEIAQQIVDQAGMAEAQQTMGQLAIQQGQLAEAQVHLQQALQLAGPLHDPRRMMLIDNDIATLNWRMSDYPAAFAHFSAALRIADQIGFRSWVGVLLGNLGVLFWELGAYDRARVCLNQALQIALALGDQSSELTCLGNIAGLLHDDSSESIGSAQQVIERAVMLGQTLRMPFYLCDHACLAAEWAFERGELAQAERYCAIAKEAAQAANDTEVLFRAQLWQARLDVAQGRRTRADGIETFMAQLHDNHLDSLDKTALLYDQCYQLSGDEQFAKQTMVTYQQLYQRAPHQRYRTRVYAIAIAAALAVPTMPIPDWVAPLCAVPLPVLSISAV